MPAVSLARAGLAAVVVAVVAVGSLHLLAADTVDPVRRTISEYALGDTGWIFDVGVLAFAAGAGTLLVALVRAGVARLVSPATALYALGVVGLLLVVVFEKTNWSVGPSVGGYVHRYASLVAFVALPLGALLLTRGYRGSRPRWVAVLGAAALAWLGLILSGIVLGPMTGVPWWQFVPLGLVERGMALTLAAMLVAVGVWATRPGSGATGSRAPGGRATIVA